jgi:hypothetical protein
MTGLRVHDSTALSPEWDRWFDEAFTDLISGDEDLVRAEFDALIAASWQSPPPPPVPPAPPAPTPSGDPRRATTPARRGAAIKPGDHRINAGHQRSPPGRAPAA